MVKNHPNGRKQTNNKTAINAEVGSYYHLQLQLSTFLVTTGWPHRKAEVVMRP